MSGEATAVRPRRGTGRRGTGPVVAWCSALAVGPVTGGLGYVLLARAWRSCDIGVSAAANSWALAPVGCGLTVAATLWWGLSLTVVGRRRGLLLGLACGLLGVLLLLWGTLAWLHAPDGYPAVHCPPDNVPPWWPDHIPL